MGIKWKEDYSAKTQRTFGLVIGLVVGVLVTVAILGRLWNWGVVTGAKWWEVMTAIGTVGSASLALVFWVVALMREKGVKNYLKDLYFIDVSYRLNLVKIEFGHVEFMNSFIGHMLEKGGGEDADNSYINQSKSSIKIINNCLNELNKINLYNLQSIGSGNLVELQELKFGLERLKSNYEDLVAKFEYDEEVEEGYVSFRYGLDLEMVGNIKDDVLSVSRKIAKLLESFGN